MAEINLAPGTEFASLARRRRRRIFGLAALIVATILIIWGGLFLLKSNYIRQQREVEQQLTSVEAEILRLGEQGKRVKLFEERLLAIAGLLDTHIAWDPFLKDLERILPPPATITRLRVDAHNSLVELRGQTPDVDIVAQTLASLASTPTRPTIFTSVVLDGITRHEQRAQTGELIGAYYEFTAHLTVDNQKLKYGQ